MISSHFKIGFKDRFYKDREGTDYIPSTAKLNGGNKMSDEIVLLGVIVFFVILLLWLLSHDGESEGERGWNDEPWWAGLPGFNN